MGLEAPLALLGLLAATLPVWIHRARRHDLPTHQLTTVELLRRAQQHQRHKQRISDLWLLVTRVLLLALACLAAAAPFALEKLAWGDGKQASVAVVLDNSLSMLRAPDGDSLLAAAVARAREIIRSVPAASEIALVAAAEPARLLVARTTDLRAAVAALDVQRLTTHAGTDLKRAVPMAAQQLASATHGTRRLIVLSDFARHAQVEHIAWPGAELTPEFEALGKDDSEPGNLSLSAARAVVDPSSPREASIAFEARSHGHAAKSVSVAAVTGQTTLAQTRVEFAKGQARGTLRVPLPPVDGNPVAHLVLLPENDPPRDSLSQDALPQDALPQDALPQDALPQDNRRAVLLRPPPALRVAIVNGDPHPGRREDETHFLTRALRAAPTRRGSVRSVVFDSSSLAPRSLAAFDVVVLANVRAPESDVAAKLERFVRAGGGLLIAPGANVVPAAYRRQLGPLLAARPLSASAGHHTGLILGAQAPQRYRVVTGLTHVRTHRWLTLEAEPAQTAFRFEDGAVALALSHLDRGSTALLATSVDDDWTDLPFRPGFLPLMSELIHGLGRLPSSHATAFAPGSAVPVSIPPGAQALEVLDPNGKRHRFDSSEHPQGVLQFRHTQLAGAYRVRTLDTRGAAIEWPRAAFVVAVDEAETDLTPGQLPVTAAQPEVRELEARELRLKHRALAPWVFLLLTPLVVLEGWLRLRRGPMKGRTRRALGAAR